MTTPHLEADLIRDEGVRLRAYRDTRGIWTIGIGHVIQADPGLTPQLAHLIDPGIDRSIVDTLFAHDVAGAKLGLSLRLPWWTGLDDVRQDVLVNMAFNLGIGALLAFHEVLGRMRAGDYVGAAAGMLDSAWARQVGPRALRLAEQMRTGVHQG